MESNTTALIVDDDRSVQRLLADTLTREGFSVIVEKDGEWALKTFEKRQIDVVLLDLLLPALHGFEVARRIRLLPKGRKVPLMFLSGIYKSQAHEAEARRKYGVVEFFDKPLNLGKLTTALKAALGDKYPLAEREAERRAQVDAKPAESFADPTAREEVAAVEHTARKSETELIHGELGSRPFPELLAELARTQATGALLLRREKIKKIVFFREGRPFFIKSNLLSECLGKIMVREKMISEADCEQSLRRMKESGRQQGTVLIEMGSINPHNLTYALSLQLQTKLWDVFGWTDGEYQFNPAAELPMAANTLEMTTAQIIYEGIKRGYDAPRVRDALGQFEPLFVHPASDPLLRFQQLGLDEEETALLAAADGHRTAQELIGLGVLPSDGALKFLYAMRCSRVVELREEESEGPFSLLQSTAKSREAAPAPEPPAAPPPLPPVQAMPPPLLPPRLPPETESAARSTSLLPELSGVFGIGVSAAEREARERLAGIAAAMRKKDYFEILGVPPNARHDDIKRAYYLLAKEYHPDKHFGSFSAEVRNLAAQIFDLVSTAHDTLTDEVERERYVSGLSSGASRDVSDEVSKILAAEGRFQKGEDLLRRRQYRDALSAFREAVSLYAEEGEFHAYLGWSMFQSEPGSREGAEKAIEHIESGIRLNPKVDKSYLFLGYIYKAISRPDRAEKQFEKAIQCNPDCIEALRELRLLGRR